MTAAPKAGHRAGGPPTFFERLQHCGKRGQYHEHTRPGFLDQHGRKEPSLVRGLRAPIANRAEHTRARDYPARQDGDARAHALEH